MSTSPGTTPLRRRDTRRAIVEAAATVIAAHGVRGLRVESVAGEAGISTGLLYYYFSDRSALVQAALDHANEQAPSMLDDDTASPGLDGRTRLIDALMAEMDEAPAVRNNSIVWNEVSASAVFEPALRDQLQDVTSAWNAKVTRTIQAGIDDRSIVSTVDPAETAEYLTSLIEGLSLRWLAGTMTLQRARGILDRALLQQFPAT